MRECVLKDVKLFNGPENCYIHVEKVGDGPMHVVLGGDDFQQLTGVFCILLQMEENSGKKVKNLLSDLAWMNRKYKNKIPSTPITLDDEASCPERVAEKQSAQEETRAGSFSSVLPEHDEKSKFSAQNC